jgi:hypothetical protein
LCEKRGASVLGAPGALMSLTFFALLIGLEVKHYVADYFLQPGWVLSGKGDFRKIGGYAHAAAHAVLTGLVLLLCQIPLATIGIVMLAEFVLHYLLDYAKIHYSRGVHVDRQPAWFWALHGIDQLFHQLTYAAIIYAVLVWPWAAVAAG